MVLIQLYLKTRKFGKPFLQTKETRQIVKYIQIQYKETPVCKLSMQNW